MPTIRSVVAAFLLYAFMAASAGAEPPAGPAKTDLKGVYAVNGELHINTFGNPEGKPITSGHQDMKPSWSKTAP